MSFRKAVMSGMFDRYSTEAKLRKAEMVGIDDELARLDEEIQDAERYLSTVPPPGPYRDDHEYDYDITDELRSLQRERRRLLALYQMTDLEDEDSSYATHEDYSDPTNTRDIELRIRRLENEIHNLKQEDMYYSEPSDSNSRLIEERMQEIRELEDMKRRFQSTVRRRASFKPVNKFGFVDQKSDGETIVITLALTFDKIAFKDIPSAEEYLKKDAGDILAEMNNLMPANMIRMNYISGGYVSRDGYLVGTVQFRGRDIGYAEAKLAVESAGYSV